MLQTGVCFTAGCTSSNSSGTKDATSPASVSMLDPAASRVVKGIQPVDECPALYFEEEEHPLCHSLLMIRISNCSDFYKI